MVLLKHLLVCAFAFGMPGASAYINRDHQVARPKAPSTGTQNTHRQHEMPNSKSPAAAFLGQPPTQFQLVDHQQPQKQQHKHQNKRVSYCLGLGKNLPVGSSNNDLRAHSVVHDVHEAVQYWNEQEYVNEYPNPLTVARAREAALIHQQVQKQQLRATTVERATLKPRIVPTRFFGDSLPIFSEPVQKQQPRSREHLVQNDKSTAVLKSVPTMRSRKPVVDRFDLNTPWVEMLIHEQQMKLQAI
jgi:hypothetical protein